eukprot:gene13533-28696_t
MDSGTTDIIDSSSTQDAMRIELLNFLDESKKKKSDDGKPLVFYPKNFDKVVEAMDRRDLFGGANNWSASMLSDKFDEDMNSNFEGGRYRHVFSDSADEMRVTRGLAEINMLDRYLQSVTRRANSISAAIISVSHRSSESPDGTFLTRVREDSARSRGSSSSSSSSSPRSEKDDGTDVHESASGSGSATMTGTGEETTRNQTTLKGPAATAAAMAVGPSSRVRRVRPLVQESQSAVDGDGKGNNDSMAKKDKNFLKENKNA